MIGAYFLGNKTIETRPLNLPEPGEGQVLLRAPAVSAVRMSIFMKAAREARM